MVKRYNIRATRDPDTGVCHPSAFEVESGSYVLYSDYAALQRQLTEAEERERVLLEKLIGLCEGLEIKSPEHLLRYADARIAKSVGEEIAKAAKLGAPLYQAQRKAHEQEKDNND